jgi:subtilisin family serine protease
MRLLLCLVLFLLPSVGKAENYIITVNPEARMSLGYAVLTNPAGLFHAFMAPIHAGKYFPSIDSFVADLTPDQLHFVRTNPSVQSVYKDGVKYLLELEQTPPPPEYTYGLVKIKIPEVRGRYPFIDGSGVVVGIIDSGIDASHPALKGKVVAFKDFTDLEKPEPYDDNGHGTHVAGTIAGVGNEPKFGVAPSVKLVIAKVFSASGGANDSTILSAMEWMLSQGVSVVSNSWGGEQDTTTLDNPYAKMVSAWVEHRMVPVFAAGNSGPSKGTMSIPGGLPEAYAVGAVNELDQLASFSSRGPIEWDGVMYDKPDICAPGVKIYSSIPNGGYKAYSGTSMATPHVAGVAALILQSNPALSVSEVKEILNASATPLPFKECGSGRLDAKLAVSKSLASRNLLLQ